MNLDVLYNKSCQRMDQVPDESIDMILTSPPYWGLRNYGEDVKEIWGGDSKCRHEFGDFLPGHHPGQVPQTNSNSLKKVASGSNHSGQFCQKCGAWEGQLGLEPTLQMYIDHLLLITLECRRVLKPTGVMWWNHADSYFTGKGSCHNPGGGNKSWKSWNERKSIFPRGRAAPNRMSKEPPPKCLALQNYRLVIRMIDEQGWTLRNDVKWNKPNGMPSSVKDRLANKYEPVFCLVKNTKPRYYWNEKTALMVGRKPSKAKQIEDTDWEWRECPKCSGHGEIIKGVQAGDNDYKIVLSEKGPEVCPRCKGTRKIKYSFWHSLGYWYDLDAIREPHKESSKKRYNYSLEGSYTPGNAYLDEKREKPQHYNLESLKSVGKNPGDVWTIATQPRPECHFASFPDALTIKPILATCPQEICNKCGKARVRITRKGELVRAGKGHISYGYKGGSKHQQNEKSTVSSWSQNFVKDGLIPGMAYEQETIGWTDCGCNAGWDSGVVLDLFAGRGTVLIMAKKLGRHYVGYELKKEYCERLIRPALEEMDPLFAKEETHALRP